RLLSSTVAPYPLVAATLGSGAPAGMNTVAAVPHSCAASATPWAWLPALAATTPLARSASDSRLIRTYAPRTLYEPARCRFSHFSQASPPTAAPTGRHGSRGVVRTTPASSWRARRTSVRETRVVMVRSCHHPGTGRRPRLGGTGRGGRSPGGPDPTLWTVSTFLQVLHVLLAVLVIGPLVTAPLVARRAMARRDPRVVRLAAN